MMMQSTAQCAAEPRESIRVDLDESVEIALADIARKLTSVSRGELLVRGFVSHLAAILGGGLRTVW